MDVKTVAARSRGSGVREQLVAALDDWAVATTDQRRRAWLLAVARRADPDPWRQRFRDPAVWQDRAALERLARQAQAQQLSPQLLTALGRVLQRMGADTVPLLTAAQTRYPQDFWLNFELGRALQVAKEPEKAIGYYRAALALRPQTSAVYNNLGLALADQGRREEAIACYHKALAFDPKDAVTHNNLGAALADKGQREEAIACYRKALALDPQFAYAHNNLGLALQEQGQREEAIACYQKAIALDPKDANAHTNLGDALKAKGQREEAIACYHQALALDPKNAQAYTNLGDALADKGQLEEAIACYHQALALDPKYALAHTNLGNALYAQGQLEEAIACYQKALAIDPKQAWVSANLKQCERLLALAPKLPAILKGETQPASAAERIEYARLCNYKQFYCASARFFADAFAADPQLAGNLKTGNRYDAACSAALAAAGQGQDARLLTAPERARLRHQALRVLWNKRREQGTPQARALVRQKMQHWQRDLDLAGIRDAAWIVNLPAEELRACRQLWADVQTLRERASDRK